MEMIIGGAFQGKGSYAEKNHPEIVWTDGETASRDVLYQAAGVRNFHLFIRKEIKEDRDMNDFARELYQKNPNLVIISDEVGYGVVPMDAFERKYREAVGRVCTQLASYSKKVTRVTLGIGTVIKDA